MTVFNFSVKELGYYKSKYVVMLHEPMGYLYKFPTYKIMAYCANQKTMNTLI